MLNAAIQTARSFTGQVGRNRLLSWSGRDRRHAQRRTANGGASPLGRGRCGATADPPKRLAGNCRHWRDLVAMSVAQRLAVETAPLDVQAYSGDWRTLEEAITRSSKTLLTGMTSKCAAHSPLLPLINLALGWSTLLQQGASGQSWLAIGWVVNRKRRTIS
jgi:hypothetical protein